MTIPPPDGSRDRRIEDPSNLLLIHPAGRALLPVALEWRVSANAVSFAGLALGIGAALAYAAWRDAAMAVLGFALSIGWLIADGLDGMVARATRTSSAFGRALDGFVDHGVFVAIYVALALSIGTAQGWTLAIAAGAAHAVQSSLYEGERARFHRRRGGVALGAPARLIGNGFVRVYDLFATSLDRAGMPFERRLAGSTDPAAFGSAYAARAVAPMRLMALLSANVRVATIFVACLIGNPRIFWWFEIVPLSVILAIGIVWHRRIERRVHPTATDQGPARFIVKEQGQS